METMINSMLNFINVSYAFSVILMTFIILYYFISKPKKKEKFIVSAVSGIILGVIWIVFIKADIEKIILSFFFAAGLYSWIKEFMLKKLKIKYNDK